MSIGAKPFDSNARVLVTGGAGFVGSHLVDRLAKDGHEVEILDDFSTGSIENLSAAISTGRVRISRASTSDRAAVAAAVDRADYVFHLASTVGVQNVMNQRIQTLSSGALGIINVLNEAAGRKVPVLFTSTSEVYGASDAVPFAETTPPAPGPSEIDRWGYAATKLFGEFLALAQHRERHSPTIVVRLFNTVGPRQSGQYGMVVPRFVSQALAHEPITVYGDGSQTRCFGYIDEVIEALLRLVRNPLAWGKVVNVGSRNEISIRDLARVIVEATGSRSRIVFMPFGEVYGPSFEDIARRVPAIERLRALTGLEITMSPEEIVRRVVAFKSNGGGHNSITDA